MPKFSPQRQTYLYSAHELAALSGLNRKTILKWFAREDVYKEEHAEVKQNSNGGVSVYYIDPETLTENQRARLPIYRSGLESRVAPSSRNFSEVATRGISSSPIQNNKFSEEIGIDHFATRENAENDKNPVYSHYSHKENIDLNRERLLLLRPIFRLEKGDRAAPVKQLAADLGVSERTVYRWLEAVEAEGVIALQKTKRADRGKPRIPPEAYDLVVHALVSNPPTSSSAIVHRTLLRAAPDAMTYIRGQKQTRVSEATVRRVRDHLEGDPFMALLFSDADHRREYLRTYVGEVVSSHANDLWEIDMTRCDVEVYWPAIGKVARPRVHACIDIYSGCVPGLVFSLEENQTQTDLCILRSLMPKTGPLAKKYPVWGIPKRIYWDNGKTYVSQHAERYLAGLGIESTHSIPKTSHTRGGIERWFGTLHNFERTLPGYVGENAQNRSSEELKRIRKNTERWAERDYTHDPGWGERMLTITEYQNCVLAWLIAEYHPWLVDGRTRLEHYQDTVPENSQVILDEAELLLLMGERDTRVVRPGGSIQFKNTEYAIPDGSLINYQGRTVLVINDQFVDDRRLLIAWEDCTGALDTVGWAEPAPTVASSVEAGDLRRASKQKAQDALAQAKELKKQLMNPELIVSRQLMKEAEVIAPRAQMPSKQARLAAVNPPPAPDLGDWGKSFHELHDTTGMTPDEYIKALDAWQSRGLRKGTE